MVYAPDVHVATEIATDVTGTVDDTVKAPVPSFSVTLLAIPVVISFIVTKDEDATVVASMVLVVGPQALLEVDFVLPNWTWQRTGLSTLCLPVSQLTINMTPPSKPLPAHAASVHIRQTLKAGFDS